MRYIIVGIALIWRSRTREIDTVVRYVCETRKKQHTDDYDDPRRQSVADVIGRS